MQRLADLPNPPAATPGTQYTPAPSRYNELALRNRHLAHVVQAISRRRDVRELRAAILLALLERRCPPSRSPARAWYVPGAVARYGARGLIGSWAHRWGETPPALRTIRAHLGELERACAIVQAPGDHMPTRRDPDHPERRPRYCDTIHVLESDEAAQWWADVGHPRIDRAPRARYSPATWRALVGGWRAEVTDAARDIAADSRSVRGQAELPFERAASPATQGSRESVRESATTSAGSWRGGPLDELVARIGVAYLPPRPAARAPSREALAELVRACRRFTPDAGELLHALDGAGCILRGRPRYRFARAPERLAAVACLLLVALARGDTVRNRAGWLVHAWTAQTGELRRAMTSVRTGPLAHRASG